jgi:hypothetical protein
MKTTWSTQRGLLEMRIKINKFDPESDPFIDAICAALARLDAAEAVVALAQEVERNGAIIDRSDALRAYEALVREQEEPQR